LGDDSILNEFCEFLHFLIRQKTFPPTNQLEKILKSDYRAKGQILISDFLNLEKIYNFAWFNPYFW